MRYDVVDTDVVVAPFVGAWIEITTFRKKKAHVRSLRSSERGLKFVPER